MSRGHPPLRQPTDEETAALLGGRSDYYMRMNFGAAAPVVARWRAELREGGRQVQTDEQVALPSQTFDGENYDSLWRAVKSHVVAENATDGDAVEANFDWGSKPVGLLLWSDWHIGSRWTNYDQLETDIVKVAAFRRQFPGALRLAHGGDLADNYFAAGKHPSGMHEQIISRTDKQRNLAAHMAEKCGSWEWLLLGCHLAWNLTQVGEDVLDPIAKRLGAINAGFGIDAHIRVGDQEYIVVARHKALGGAALNPGNQQRRMDDEYGPNGERADVISTSHQHVDYLQVQNKAGRRVVYTRSGAYKGGDCFARQGGFTHNKSADTGVPLLIFHPDQHHVTAFDGHNWREGLDYLAGLHS